MDNFVLTLDDYSPHPQANNLEWCNKLIEHYPDVKIDLFVPAAYARLGDEPFWLSKYPEWVEQTKQLPSNYRLNLHGLHHRRSHKDFHWHNGINSNNNEFENTTYKQTDLLLTKIKEEFDKTGLKYTKIFRPPGWHIGLGAIELLTRRGYLIAGNETYYKKFKYIKGLKWKNYNWDMVGKCNITTGNVVAFGHTTEWTNNCMNQERLELILQLLEERKFDFKFIEEI